MNKGILIVILLVWLLPLGAQNKYRITLKDKVGTEYSVHKPEAFLSLRAIQRREKQNIKITQSDLPVSQTYLDSLKRLGLEMVTTSKWNNTVTVRCNDTLLMNDISVLPFVVQVEKVWVSPGDPSARNKKRKSEVTNRLVKTDEYYGSAYRQIQIHNGDSLHAVGFRGEGMHIAVIDGGFYNVDVMKAFKNIRLSGVRDFVNPDSDIYSENEHGMKVLSCMAVNEPYVLVGTAPEASYWLLRSEDTDSEQWVEQDYWAAAVEFADSVGVDVINTSLGYRAFEDASLNYQYENLDGKYSFISRTAGMIADKGMLLVCSAGNEGQKTWKKVTPPADADNVLAVGAVDSSLMNAVFSSVGNTADGRVKPDVMSLGAQTIVIGGNGEVTHINGTSFASPVLCGLVACLWQAFPELTAKELIKVIRWSGSCRDNPDNVFGYGIPDIWKAYHYLNAQKQNK